MPTYKSSKDKKQVKITIEKSDTGAWLVEIADDTGFHIHYVKNEDAAKTWLLEKGYVLGAKIT